MSLTLTPMMCSRFIRREAGQQHGWLYRWSERVFDGMRDLYAATLRWSMARRPLVLAVFLMTLAGTFYLYSVIQKDFLPAEDTGRLIVFAQGAEDASYDAMVRNMHQLSELAARDPNVDAVMTRVGTSGSRVTANAATLFVRLKDRDLRPDSDIGSVVQKLRRRLNVLPGLKVFVRNPPAIRVGGRLSNAQYQYTLQDLDLDTLYKWSGILADEMGRVPGFQDVSTDLNISSPSVVLRIDRDKAGSLGINAEQIENVLASAFGSRRVSTIYGSSSQHAVILEIDPKYQKDPSALSKLYVRSRTGTLVPLDAVTTANRDVSPLSISHQGQLPAVTISFSLAPGVTLGTALERIRKLERDLQMPATLTASFAGTAKVFEESLTGMGLLLVMAILVVYIVLGILYESFIHPLTILSGLPAAGVGALLTLLLFGVPLSLYAFVGIIMLVGIVKKNAIMMIDFALVAQREQNKAPADAIYEACLIRFRPIMMTTMAALMGSLPIAIGFGQGGEARAPLGLAVVGGLVFSQIITLYLTPVVYLYLDRLQHLGAKRETAQPAAAPAKRQRRKVPPEPAFRPDAAE